MLLGFERLSQVHELPQMVRIVVCEYQDLAQKRLSIALGNSLIELFFRSFLQQILHLFQIVAKLLDALLPSPVARRRFRVWPVSLRPFWRDMLRIAAELEYVPLSDAHVLEQLPRRVRCSLNSLPAQLGWEVFDRILKVNVCSFRIQQIEKLLLEFLKVFHGSFKDEESDGSDSLDRRRVRLFPVSLVYSRMPKLLTLVLLANAIATFAQGNSGASDILRRSIDAVGGEETLRSIHTVSFKAIGHRNALEQSIRPEGPWFVDYQQIQETRDFDQNRLRDDIESRGYYGEWWRTAEWQKNSVIISDGVSAQIGPDGKLSPGRSAVVQDAQESLAFGPERLLFNALLSKDLHREPDVTLHGYQHHALSFHLNGTAVRILFSPTNYYPAVIELRRSRPYNTFWSSWGDITTRISWDLWVLEANGVHYPHQWTYESNGLPEKMLFIQDVTFNSNLSAATFDIPTDIKTVAEKRRRAVEEIPFGLPDSPAREVTMGLWQVPGAWNVEEVHQADGIVLIEGPLSNSYSAHAIEDAEKRFAPLKVKAVITTSDSWPHIGGMREYMARGIEIYVLDLNRPILERLAAAPHESQPDDLARAPRKAKFHVITTRTVVGSGATRMEIIPLRTISGERQMIVYFPESRTLYTSDLFAKLPDGSFWLPQFLQELKSVVDQEHLEVNTIFGMHYEPTPWTDFLRSLNASSKGQSGN